MLPDAPAIRAFYAASLIGLRLLDARLPSPRRFGPDADARWNNFAGHLTARDRLDILLRDADAEHPGAFSARLTFDLEAVIEDDPFGPTWPGLDRDTAAALFRTAAAAPPPEDIAAALQDAAAAWGLAPARIDVGPLDDSTHVLLTGAGALLSLALTFAGRTELSFGGQVTLIATHPAERHLAALAAAALASRCPRILSPTAGAPPGARWDRALASPDADPAARARVAALCPA